MESEAAQSDKLTPATLLSPTRRVGDAQMRYFFLRRSSSMDANPTPNTVIDAGSGTANVSLAKAGNVTIDSKITEDTKRMDFS